MIVPICYVLTLGSVVMVYIYAYMFGNQLSYIVLLVKTLKHRWLMHEEFCPQLTTCQFRLTCMADTSVRDFTF